MNVSEATQWTRDGRFLRRGTVRAPLRGIAYGPFEKPLGEQAACQRDLDHIASLGFDALRIYERPSPAFLLACAARDLAVFVSLKWASNTDFRESREAVLAGLVADVRALQGAPAVAGYFIGNEIPATLVRWMGGESVRRFLEKAFVTLRAEDPNRLLAYANYPSTEYLHPRNADFTAFNIYLEERPALQRYLRRLHHLADDRPLVVSEYGLDSLRNGEARQAEVLAWLTEEIYASGAAGSFLFSYTDDWFNGGRQMDDWGFGIVARDRSPKPSAAGVSALLQALPWRPTLTAPPRVSVIVCTRNGHAYLPACLRALATSHYPDQEVIVIDDGSRPGIEVMVSEHEGMRYVRQEPLGLSAARNRGAREATGAILVFTDDDCEPDPDWLGFLVQEMTTQGLDACGGPNIAPETDEIVEQCVAAAPGNPTHVMLDDYRAEHLPGCNLAVTRDAFDAVGGFQEHYRVAGDDVDFCWRLQADDRVLGFAPNAVVWHHRRKTWRAFARQQVGYGKAEALLQWDHPQKFTPAGTADWKGTVYAPLAARALSRPVIYFGADGMAPFQTIYHPRRTDPFWTSVPLSFPWLAAIALLFVFGCGVTMAWWLAALMLTISLGLATQQAWTVALPRGATAWKGRLWLAWLHWAPTMGRQSARWLLAAPRRWSMPFLHAERAFWNTAGIGREAILAEVRKDLLLGGHQLGPTKPNQWSPFDLLLPSTAVANVTLLTVTEHHDQREGLTRLGVKAYLKRGVWASLTLLTVFVLGQAMGGHWWWAGYGGVAVALLLGAVTIHTRRCLRRWLDSLGHLAEKAGLKVMEK